MKGLFFIQMVVRDKFAGVAEFKTIEEVKKVLRHGICSEHFEVKLIKVKRHKIPKSR